MLRSTFSTVGYK